MFIYSILLIVLNRKALPQMIRISGYRLVILGIAVLWFGSYRVESRGIALFEEIACADHTAITGLPLIAVTTLLREAGFAVP